MSIPPAPPDPETRLASLAVERGLLSREQVDACLSARVVSDPSAPLELMFVSLGYLTGLQADDLVRAAQEPETPEELIRIVGSCTVLAPLGRGPSGSVHRAFHGKLGKEVALKVIGANSLNAPLLDRFEERSRRALGMEHPNLARILEVGRQDGALYIASALLPGMPLLNALAGGEPLDLPSALKILKQAAAALHSLHGAGAVHGNLKPENVFLTGGTTIQLTDPGLARDGGEYLREHADLVGSLVFSMAPEQWAGEAGPATDLYQCGVLWHFMLTAKTAFGHRWTREIRKNHEQGTARPPSAFREDLPPAADAIFTALVQAEPRRRYPGAEELVDDLERVEKGQEPAGPRRSIGPRPTKIRRPFPRS